MKISDYAKAQGWLKRHASSENSAGEWEKYAALNRTPELDEAIRTIDDKFGPGTVFPASEAPIPPKTLDRDMWESANERLGFNDGQLVTPSVDGRTSFSYAGIVKQGPRKDMHKYLDFYSKKQAKELGKDTTSEWFKSKPEMDAALKKRKETTGKGLTDAELTKKYKKFLKEEGFKTWAEAPDDAKGRMKTALYNEQNPYESQAKWKEEGLKTRVNEETRKLFKKNPPINPKTGLPMTLQEFTALTDGQKTKLLGRLKGKVKPRAYAKRQGWYPEKQANKLMVFLQTAAKKQEKLPLKERTFINVFEGEKFVGVKDKRKNTLWTHVDYDLTGKKNAKVITDHPGNKNVQFFLNQADKFKYETPDKLLGSYFSKYKRVPKYSEMYQFFNVDPQSAGAKKGKAYKVNPLQQHHQELMAKEPAKNIQLTLSKQNTEASRILNQFEKGTYSFTEADKKLKELGVRIKGSKGWMGPKSGEITAAKSIEAAQAETVKMFKEAYKKNPKIVDQMTKALDIAFKERGIKLKKGQAGFIAKDLLKDIGKLGPKGLRLLASDWVWPEIAIGWLEKQNNIQKGMSPERASSEMWKTVTFGLRDKGGTENAIVGQAKELGYGEKDITALENIMNYGKVSKKIDDTEMGIEKIEKGYTPFTSEAMVRDLKEKLENLKKEQENAKKNYFGAIGDKDSTYGFDIYDQASKELLRKEWNRSLEGRKKRTDPYAGQIGSELGQIFATTPNWYKTQELIKNMNPQELNKFNLQERGIGYERAHPMYGAALSDKQMESLRDQMGYMYSDGGRASYMGGGIAGIRRPNAIPPESGPTPQGLPSMYNRVKKI